MNLLIGYSHISFYLYMYYHHDGGKEWHKYNVQHQIVSKTTWPSWQQIYRTTKVTIVASRYGVVLLVDVIDNTTGTVIIKADQELITYRKCNKQI